MGIPEDIGRLEQELRELIVKYEQYFFGIEKREPLQLLEQVERVIKRYQSISIPNTMLRFRYDSLVASLGVHRQKWTRVNRLIEDGKYDRDRYRMAMHRGEAAGEDSAPIVSALLDPQLERVFQEYRSARLACNLPVENVTREKIALAIKRNIPALMEKYHCTDIELFVVIDKGTPSLKARQKNS